MKKKKELSPEVYLIKDWLRVNNYPALYSLFSRICDLKERNQKLTHEQKGAFDEISWLYRTYAKSVEVEIPMPDPKNAGKPSSVCMCNPTSLGWMRWPWDDGKRTCPHGNVFYT